MLTAWQGFVCVCFMIIITCVPECVYAEPLKAMIWCVYLATKGQTVTDGPVLQRKSSMLLFRYCCTLSTCFSDGKTFYFTCPSPVSPSITRSTIDRVMLSSRSSRYGSASRRRQPPPCALPVWGCGRWPSPPFPSCFRPTRLILPEKLCVSVAVWISRSGAECDWLGCNVNFLGSSPEGLEFAFGESEM